MSQNTKPGPNTLTPHMVVKNAAAAIEFYKKAFGAMENCRLSAPNGLLIHAQVQIGNSRLMLMDEMECPNGGSAKSALELGGSPISLHLHVEDADAAFQQAIAAGAEETMPLQDMFWGDRYGRLKDPFGYEWSIASTIQEMSQADMQAAADQMCKQLQPTG